MKTAPDNPQGNQLATGLGEEQILSAVEKSGYPLQTVTGEILGKHFRAQHEWCYVDRDEKRLRTLDIHARRDLFDWNGTKQPRVRPHLDLLVECKQSQLPYVFFVSDHNKNIFDHSEIIGLKAEASGVSSDDGPSAWNVAIPMALGLTQDVFKDTPPHCNSFSKCVRKGSELELSGTDAYSGLVLPLIKGVHHLRKTEQPTISSKRRYFDAHLVIALGVLDAPMIGVSTKDGASTLTLTPWVRIMRHEYAEEGNEWNRDRHLAVDVVHKEFLATYVQSHLL